MVLTTLHANSPKDMIMRLVTMVRYGVDLPVDVIERNIASAIDLVIQVARYKDGRRFVSEISVIEQDGLELCATRPLFERSGLDACGTWHALPAWVEESVAQGLVKESEVKRWRQAPCCS